MLFSKESGSRYFIYKPRKTLYDGEAEFVDGIQVRVVGLQRNQIMQVNGYQGQTEWKLFHDKIKWHIYSSLDNIKKTRR